MFWSLIAEKIYRPYKPNLNWAKKKHVKFRYLLDPPLDGQFALVCATGKNSKSFRYSLITLHKFSVVC